MTHQHATLGDTLYFWFAANDTSGSAGDGSSPLFDVRLGGAAAGAAPTLSGSPSLLTDAGYPAGCHEISIAATGGNGFAADQTYGVFCTLAIDAQNPAGFVGSFSLSPIVANVTEWSSSAAAVKLGATDGLPQTSPHGWQGVTIPAGNMIEDNAGARWTAKALEQAPSGGGGSANPEIGGTPSLNDQKKGEITRVWFVTKDTGGDLIAPTVTGSVYALEADGVTQVTAGITATYNVSQNGVHRVDIDTSNAEYEAEKDYTIVADGLTIDGVAGLSRTIAQFTVRASSIDDVFGSGYIDDDWDWDTDTTATDPGNGNVKVNNANYNLATQCFISAISARGSNATLVIEALQAGDALLIARKNDPAAEYILAEVIGIPTDNTGWYTIPITTLATLGTLGNNNAVTVGFRFAPAVQPFTVEDAAQTRYRLQMDSGSQTAPGSDAPAQLPVDIQAYDGSTAAVKVGSSGLPDVNAEVLADDPTAAGNLADFANAGYDAAENKVNGVKTVDDLTQNSDKTGYSLAADITVKKGVALPQVHFQMVDTSDVPATGLTVTAQIVKDAGALAAVTNPVQEIGNGLYRINGGLTATETNADAFTLQFTATGAKTLAIGYLTQAE